MRTSSLRLALILAAAAAAAACGEKSTPGETGTGPGPTPPSAEGPQAPGAPKEGALAEKTPPTAEELAPTLQPFGAEGEVPQKLVLSFARPVATPGQVGQEAPAGTVLTFAPDVEGKLTVTGPTQLTFVPEGGFPFNARFEVRLDAVATPAGVVQSPSAGAWATSFDTPAFAFLRLSTQQIDYGRSRVQVALSFSGPVRPDQVRDHLRFDVGGARSLPFQLTQGDSPGRVVASLTGPALRPNSTLRLTVKEGVTSTASAQARAPAANSALTLPGGERMTIHAAHLVEGQDGFYVEVICQDKAAGGERYYWDRNARDSYYISRRCQLTDADARSFIRFSPPVAFQVTPGSGGFRILGDFKRGPLSLNVSAGAVTVDGGLLMNAFSQSFTVPARSPKIRFTSVGRYLPKSAWKNLAVQHTNVGELELLVRQVPPHNLVYWLTQTGTERADERTSDLLVKKTVKVPSPADEQHTSWINLRDLLPGTTRGVLEITARHGSVSAVSRLLLTDLSLVAKKSLPPPGKPHLQEVFVWALGMEDGQPLGGVELELKRKSGKTVARCTTDGSGGCRLRVGEGKDPDTSVPFVIVATRGEDLTYLRYEDLKTDTSGFEVAGEPYLSDRVYRASVWSDRGVYRPGEKAHLAAIVRDQKSVAPPAGLPVDLKLYDPRGQVVKQLQLQTNAAGMVAHTFPFASFADTGAYRVELTVAKKAVASYRFNVEEFVPERMKVMARSLKEAWALGDTATIGVKAEYLFGGSAEGSRVQLTCRLEPSTFRPKENGQYHYGVYRESGKAPRPLVLGDVEGSLDDKGQVSLDCPQLQTPGAFNGPARLVAAAAVFEGGSGRSTLGEAQVPVHPERYYVGMQTGTEKFEPNQPFAVNGVVVDWAGKLLPSAVSQLEVEFIRLQPEYGYYWDEEEGTESYRRYLRPTVEGRTLVPVKGGKFTVQANPTRPGAAYLVRVKSGGTQTDLKVEGDGSYWWWGHREEVDQTPKPLKPSTVAVTLPDELRVGEAAKVSFRAPFKGRALVTVEADRVLQHHWMDVDAGDVSWSFELERFVPNVYVSAFVVKDPHLEAEESFLPDRAFGVASARVVPEAFEQELTLTVPDEVRSNSRLEVKLDLGPVEGKTFATVAVVDEGILSLTRFQSPNPFDDIFTRRALGVETYETIGWTLLMPPSGPQSRTGGGDEGEGGPGRVQPIKPVALWSGLVEVPSSGKLTLPFEVPQYRGKLRVMAVAAGPKKMAHASTQVTVRDPLVLQTTLPRFVLHGDTLQIPVFLTNMSGKALDVKVSLRAEPLPVGGAERFVSSTPPLEFLGKAEGTTHLENGKSATLVFQARAALTVGAATLKVTAKGGGFESHEDLDVPFNPSGPRERTVQKIELAEGEVDLKPYLQGWVPTSERSTFWVTSNPYGESFDHLSYLIRYPYGCIEQTTSSTRPLLFVSQLIQNVDPTVLANRKIDDMVMHGVNRVLSMQTPSGGFGYWLGDTSPTPWGTAYATHMLLDAQKAGYAVPQDRLDRALEYVKAETSRYASGKATQYGDHGWSTSAEAYMHYLLALTGDGNKARILQLIKETGFGGRNVDRGVRAEEQYMLKAALYLAGDRRYEKDLRNPDASPIQPVRQNGWSFYSDLRRRGFVLSTFQDLFGKDGGTGEALAQRVADGLRGKRSGWYSTQELVWGVTGLGKRVADASKDYEVGALIANGKERTPRKGQGAERSWTLHRASEYDSLKLRMKDTGEGKVFLVLSSEGVRKDGRWRYGGNGLKVTRRYRSLDGTVIDPAAGMSLADLAFVEVEIGNTSGSRIQNIALVDRLPAGWEIENPRLGRGTPVSWVDPQDTWKADFMNVRDDRLEVFGALNAHETKSVVYAVRAVTAGSFTLPPVEAEAMYDPDLWAREPGGTVVVRGAWDDYLL